MLVIFLILISECPHHPRASHLSFFPFFSALIYQSHKIRFFLTRQGMPGPSCPQFLARPLSPLVSLESSSELQLDAVPSLQLSLTSHKEKWDFSLAQICPCSESPLSLFVSQGLSRRPPSYSASYPRPRMSVSDRGPRCLDGTLHAGTAYPRRGVCTSE